ncbi:hypothetical protein GCM10010329_81910 [Streptomyces spiroverticillatus]|uniref:Uncharacterized protein n=1 Tax=Streptomyces finlayi TaxID=67296 RepID=A0A918X8H0_9ACTN|nr:hypothetical protein GCM10010329_81910 [Streptomyces spiroverticillatus]GHD18294.1 hypothetical protein GCM10010334_80990 [Streptomyces finlayi]
MAENGSAWNSTDRQAVAARSRHPRSLLTGGLQAVLPDTLDGIGEASDVAAAVVFLAGPKG